MTSFSRKDIILEGKQQQKMFKMRKQIAKVALKCLQKILQNGNEKEQKNI